ELMLGVGLANGLFGIIAAHELLHRCDRVSRIGAQVLLSTALYGHFCVSHVLVHHRLVATPSDPATAARGESLYGFFGRTIVEGFLVALRAESGQTETPGGPGRALRNAVVRSVLVNAALICGIAASSGLAAAGFFIGQACIAVYTLEAINYVQHYG